VDLTPYIRDIPDFPKPGILFKDITPLLAKPAAFQAAIDRLWEFAQVRKPDAVAAAEARGFFFAAPLALLLRVPLIPLRKPGKLPYRTHVHRYDLEYGQAELHVHIDGIRTGSQVLLIDDVLATGGTMLAGRRLIEKAGGHVNACAFLVELTFLKGREKLAPLEVFSVLRYD
jgi:adenine phosphoribosyltransferase